MKNKSPVPVYFCVRLWLQQKYFAKVIYFTPFIFEFINEKMLDKIFNNLAYSETLFDLTFTSGFATTHVVVSVRHPITY